MDRRDAVLALLALGATPLSSFAQPQGKLWRIGFLVHGAPSRFAAQLLRNALRDVGYAQIDQAFAMLAQQGAGAVFIALDPYFAE